MVHQNYCRDEFTVGSRDMEKIQKCYDDIESNYKIDKDYCIKIYNESLEEDDKLMTEAIFKTCTPLLYAYLGFSSCDTKMLSTIVPYTYQNGPGCATEGDQVCETELSKSESTCISDINSEFASFRAGSTKQIVQPDSCLMMDLLGDKAWNPTMSSMCFEQSRRGGWFDMSFIWYFLGEANNKDQKDNKWSHLFQYE